MEAVGGSPERTYPVKDRAHQHPVGLFPVRGVAAISGWVDTYIIKPSTIRLSG